MSELAICTLCGRRPAIVGLTSERITSCEVCYGRLVENRASWNPQTSRRELREMVRLRVPISLQTGSK